MCGLRYLKAISLVQKQAMGYAAFKIVFTLRAASICLILGACVNSPSNSTCHAQHTAYALLIIWGLVHNPQISYVLTRFHLPLKRSRLLVKTIYIVLIASIFYCKFILRGDTLTACSLELCYYNFVFSQLPVWLNIEVRTIQLRILRWTSRTLIKS